MISLRSAGKIGILGQVDGMTQMITMWLPIHDFVGK